MFEIRRKSFYRLKINELAKGKIISGMVVDLGGGKRASYMRYFRIEKRTKVVSLNSSRADLPTKVCDLNDGIPLGDGVADFVLAFNLFEHVFEHKKILDDVRRILKKDGIFYGATPFLKEVHADPEDFFRITPDGWRKMLLVAGFKNFQVLEIGLGPFVASFSLVQTVFPTALNLVLYPLCLLADRLLLFFRPYWRGKYILGVFISARKSS